MNIKTLSDRLGLDEEDFLVLLDLLISTAQTDLEKLRESVKNNEMDVTVNLAHSLKGSAGNLGFMDFSALAAEIEIKAKQVDHGITERDINDLCAEFEKMKKLSEGL